MSDDKRENPRVEFSSDAEIVCADKTIRGEISNLSMKGMFVSTAEKLSVGDDANLTINLNGSTTKLSVEIKGRVERIDPSGVGIKFAEMELDSFIHLRNIVFYADHELHEYYEFM